MNTKHITIIYKFIFFILALITFPFAASSETTVEGSGGVELDASNSFPAGITIYGRYTEIEVAGGTIIAYWGK